LTGIAAGGQASPEDPLLELDVLPLLLLEVLPLLELDVWPLLLEPPVDEADELELEEVLVVPEDVAPLDEEVVPPSAVPGAMPALQPWLVPRSEAPARVRAKPARS
jgi:hypothetical protein